MPDVARFTLAYEGMFNIVMAVLEFHGVRPGDTGGHRQIAIQRAAADVQLEASKFSALLRLHDIRNRVTYRTSIPPLTRSDADAMQEVFEDFLNSAESLLGSG